MDITTPTAGKFASSVDIIPSRSARIGNIKPGSEKTLATVQVDPGTGRWRLDPTVKPVALANETLICEVHAREPARLRARLRPVLGLGSLG